MSTPTDELPRIVAIAERGHVPDFSTDRIERCREAWANHPVRAAMCLESMKPGTPTRRRLDAMLGFAVSHVANLLPPSQVIGEWSDPEARRNAEQIWEHIVDEADVRVILLGRKVLRAVLGPTATWADGLRFGTTIKFPGWRNSPALFMPHPSGRSRVLNDPDEAKRLRAAALEWAHGRLQ